MLEHTNLAQTKSYSVRRSPTVVEQDYLNSENSKKNQDNNHDIEPSNNHGTCKIGATNSPITEI